MKTVIKASLTDTDMVSHQALPRTRLSNSYLIHNPEEIHLCDDDAPLYLAADPDDPRPPCPLNQDPKDQTSFYTKRRER